MNSKFILNYQQVDAFNFPLIWRFSFNLYLFPLDFAGSSEASFEGLEEESARVAEGRGGLLRRGPQA